MTRDIGRFYLRHLHATASAPELVRRAVEQALSELKQGEVERFARRLTRLRRSLRLDMPHRPTAAALIRVFTQATAEARRGDPAGAASRLDALVTACAEARPRGARA